MKCIQRRVVSNCFLLRTIPTPNNARKRSKCYTITFINPLRKHFILKDVYSYGMVLYEMSTGKISFQGIEDEMVSA